MAEPGGAPDNGLPSLEPTRLIAMGSRPLMDGFNLIGFEIHPDAQVAELEQVLEELLRNRARALLILEHYLAASDSPVLAGVRSKGGRIVVTEIPELHAPEDYHPLVEDLVARNLGPGALEERQ